MCKVHLLASLLDIATDRVSKNPRHAGSLSCSSIPSTLLYVYVYVGRLGVGDDGGSNGEKEKKENSQRRRRRRTESSGRRRRARALARHKKNQERENLCSSSVLNAAVKGFCVDHFLSLSLSFSLSKYQCTRNARRRQRTSESSPSSVRRRPFSLVCSLQFSCCEHIHVLFASPLFVLLLVAACVLSYCWSKGCSEVNFILARSLCILRSFRCLVKIKTL